MRFKIKRLGNDFDIKYNRRYFIGISGSGVFHLLSNVSHPLSPCFRKLDGSRITPNYLNGLKIFTSLLISR